MKLIKAPKKDQDTWTHFIASINCENISVKCCSSDINAKHEKYLVMLATIILLELYKMQEVELFLLKRHY